MTLLGAFVAYGLGIFLVAFTVTYVYIKERKALILAGNWK